MDEKAVDEAKLYLLDPESTDNERTSAKYTQNLPQWLSSYRLIVIHFLFLFANICLLVGGYTSIKNSRSPAANVPYDTPIHAAIEWERQHFDVDVGHYTEYTGPPSYDRDLAWHKLFENSNIRVTAEELARVNKTSVGLSDGDGFMANLDVHHQLHCLKYLRYFVYPDYYKEEIEKKGIRHADHCIENLRRNIMCTPSLELLTLHWAPDRVLPSPQFSYDHTCMNWEKLDAWMWERSFDVFDKSLLVNPILDPSLVDPEAEE